MLAETMIGTFIRRERGILDALLADHWTQLRRFTGGTVIGKTEMSALEIN